MRLPALLIRISAAVLAAAAFSGQAARAADPDGIPYPPRSRPAGLYQQRALSRLAAGVTDVPDTLRLLVLRVEYADMGFTSPPHDSLYFANEMRHTWEYFRGASGGAFGLGWEIAAGVTELSFEADYYGAEDLWEERVSEILMEAVRKNDDQIDFSAFDAFAIIHPGAGQETDFSGDSPWQLWSGFIDPVEMRDVLEDTLGTPGVPTNDLVEGDTFYVDNVMVLPEDASQDGLTFGSLGIYAYQVGMRLGMIPMYDTTPSSYPDSQGIGAFGLMGYGLYNASGFIPAFPCAFHRYLMGWAEPVRVESDGDIRLTDISTAAPADTSLVRIDITPTEYYLISNRVHDTDFDGRFDFGDINGNGLPENEDTLLGAEFDFFLTATTNPYHYEDIGGEQVRIVDTGSGMMVWHIDETIIRNKLSIGRYPNDDPGLSGVDLEEADGVQDLDRPGGSHAFGSWGDSYRNGWYDAFGPGTIPSSTANTGTATGIGITALSGPGRAMSVNVGRGAMPARVTAEMEGTVMGLPPAVLVYDQTGEPMVVQAADTGKIYISRGIGALDWDGGFDLVADIPGAVWSGTPILTDFDGNDVPEAVAGSRDGRLHAWNIDGTPFPIDTGPDIGSLDVKGDIVSMPCGLVFSGDHASAAVFLVSDGDTTWMYVLGEDLAGDLPGGALVGDGVYETVVSTGRMISHPVLCRGESGGFSRSICTVVSGPDGSLRFIQIGFIEGVTPGLSLTSWRIEGEYGSEDLLLPAAGDVDKNRIDDFVLAIPGGPVLYIDPGRGVETSGITLDRPSAPSLSDIDDDGILDTIIRDRDGLYLLTGFGTLVSGWPVRLDDNIVRIEPDTTPAQPLAVPFGGPDRRKPVFNVAGELRAYEPGGSMIAGWPVIGEGDHTITPSVIRGEDGSMYFIISGGSGGIAGADQTGTSFFPGSSTVTRISTGLPYYYLQAWLTYRHDEYGTGRQERTGEISGGEPVVAEESFICYPNPATGVSFRVRLDISGRADVTVRLFNLEGTEVLDITASHDWEGEVPFEKEISTDGLASGIYLCHVSVTGEKGDWSGAKKVAVVR